MLRKQLDCLDLIVRLLFGYGQRIEHLELLLFNVIYDFLLFRFLDHFFRLFFLDLFIIPLLLYLLYFLRLLTHLQL